MLRAATLRTPLQVAADDLVGAVDEVDAAVDALASLVQTAHLSAASATSAVRELLRVRRALVAPTHKVGAWNDASFFGSLQGWSHARKTARSSAFRWLKRWTNKVRPKWESLREGW